MKESDVSMNARSLSMRYFDYYVSMDGTDVSRLCRERKLFKVDRSTYQVERKFWFFGDLEFYVRGRLAARYRGYTLTYNETESPIKLTMKPIGYPLGKAYSLRADGAEVGRISQDDWMAKTISLSFFSDLPLSLRLILLWCALEDWRNSSGLSGDNAFDSAFD